jgi:nitrogen regulatory protein PII
MKLITAIIRPNMLDKLVVALEDVQNFPGMTVSEAEGFGQRLRTNIYDSLNPFKPKKRIEIAANDDMADEIVKVIRSHAHTGKKGDGIIFVLPIEDAVLI